MKQCRRDAHELADLYIGIGGLADWGNGSHSPLEGGGWDGGTVSNNCMRAVRMIVFSAVSGRGLFGMRAFFLPSCGDVNAPARSGEQPVASHAPRSFEQRANPIHIHEGVDRVAEGAKG